MKWCVTVSLMFTRVPDASISPLLGYVVIKAKCEIDSEAQKRYDKIAVGVKFHLYLPTYARCGYLIVGKNQDKLLYVATQL